ncbi:hypothetical protein [Streptomyces sp. NPDC004267]|uniref:hypothetical protein n=1 Tax=Streptomyces sp. NPDC004267 TaxID=3364694 RepID=UPI0036D19A84
MTTTSATSDGEYGAARAAAALWAGTSVLVTDVRGQVLVQHVDYRPTCLLVLLDPATGAASMPPLGNATAAVPVGHLTEPAGPYAHALFAAPLTHHEHSGPGHGPDAGPTGKDTRILATPEQAAALFDHGPTAADQLLAAVHDARERLGIPRAAPRPVTELAPPRTP